MKRLTNTYFFSTSFCTNFAPKNNKSILFKYAVRHISPFEGSPRAGVAEYVYRGMLPPSSSIKLAFSSNLFVQNTPSFYLCIIILIYVKQSPKTNK